MASSSLHHTSQDSVLELHSREKAGRPAPWPEEGRAGVLAQLGAFSDIQAFKQLIDSHT